MPSPDGRFAGKVALVTGAGSGIGRAVALRFAAEGAKVVAVDANAAGAAETAKLGEGAVVAQTADVTKLAELDTAAAEAKRLGGLDLVAACAGIGGLTRFEDLTEESWRKTIDVNLTGMFLTLKATVPLLLEKKGGVITTIASQSGILAHAYAEAYNASKAGVLMLTKCVAIEYAKQGLRANTLCPGGVMTPLIGNFRLEGYDTEITPRAGILRKLSKPEEIAALVAFLSSDEASFITGQAISIDGGASALRA
jgi:meso-butanediol dehydrogenase / (S,S)-butanediol dehydrogenase / diacetyl reductase